MLNCYPINVGYKKWVVLTRTVVFQYNYIFLIVANNQRSRGMFRCLFALLRPCSCGANQVCFKIVKMFLINVFLSHQLKNINSVAVFRQFYCQCIYVFGLFILFLLIVIH